jgi:hypothetical protein
MQQLSRLLTQQQQVWYSSLQLTQQQMWHLTNLLTQQLTDHLIQQSTEMLSQQLSHNATWRLTQQLTQLLRLLLARLSDQHLSCHLQGLAPGSHLMHGLLSKWPISWRPS